MDAFWPWQKQNSDFQYLAIPVGYVGGLRWWWGLKTNFKIFLKGIFVQEGSSGTHFDHGQFEIKSFPMYASPYYVGHVWNSTAEAAATWEYCGVYFEGMLRLLHAQYSCHSSCMHSTPVTVAACTVLLSQLLQRILNSTPACSSLSSTASYETYVAGQRNLDVYF